MIGKLLAGGAAVIALSLGPGQALAQQASANGQAVAKADNVGSGAAGALAAGRTGAERRTRRDAGHGNVVTKTLGEVPGLVGGTVGGAVGNGASLIGGTVGGALGVDKKPKPDETPSRP